MHNMFIHTGFRFGKSFIPVSDEDIMAIKPKNARNFSVIGFTRMENIEQHHFLMAGTVSVKIVVAMDEVS